MATNYQTSSPPLSFSTGHSAETSTTRARPIFLRPAIPSLASGGHRENGEPRHGTVDHEAKNEQFLLHIQERDQTISSITAENVQLSSALRAAEDRVNQFYADYRRMEDELATRLDVLEKIRARCRELEKEKRDTERRYNTQAATFEAERQAFYDNEHHLKSRIQSLSEARRSTRAHEPGKERQNQHHRDTLNDQESTEMSSLRLQLSTLSTSYSSLQTTHMLLQTQLGDLKKANHELQEENESFLMLLRDKTLSGQFEVTKQAGDGYDFNGIENTDQRTFERPRSKSRGTLDRVEEMAESYEEDHERSPELRDFDPNTRSRPRHPGRTPRRRAPVSHIGEPRGESLADLPITGPGLDLAAELGRAESKDDSTEASIAKSDGLGLMGKQSDRPKRKGSMEDIDKLRTEVKSLKDANKALSLYASKILDRIISQEGFEQVLAADYDKPLQPPLSTSPIDASNDDPIVVPPNPSESPVVNQSRPTGGIGVDGPRVGSIPHTATSKAPAPAAPSRANRLSLSFDWKNFSMFGGEKRNSSPGLRPLTLRPGSNAVTARKLETYEDDDDRRERERLKSTMKLMGLHQPPTAITPTRPSAFPSTAMAGNHSRHPSSRSRSTTNIPPNSMPWNNHYDGGDAPINLTSEVLTQAEAEQSLADLDAQEQVLSTEIARGASGGFTELSARKFYGEGRSRRSRKSGESGSTVWSAGMGKGEDEYL